MRTVLAGRLEARGTIGLAFCLAMLTLVPPVAANHSLPTPPIYWDSNNDTIADDIGVLAKRSGAPWSVDSATRFDTADDVWRNGTQFDVNTSTSSGQPVYRDRLASCLSTWRPSPTKTIVAVVCVQKQAMVGGTYYKLIATPTYFNHQLHLSGLSWYYEAGAPPNPATQVHFGGTAVHELGHWILLADLNCQAGFTMCNQNQNGTQDFNQFSLDPDDVSAANAIY